MFFYFYALWVLQDYLKTIPYKLPDHTTAFYNTFTALSTFYGFLSTR
jgi:hypothetical protein